MNKKLSDFVKHYNLPEATAKALDAWVNEHRDKIDNSATCGIGVIVDATGKTSDTHLVKWLNGLAVYYDDETKWEVGQAVHMRGCPAIHAKAWEIM
jgi:hypothetical protein